MAWVLGEGRPRERVFHEKGCGCGGVLLDNHVVGAGTDTGVGLGQQVVLGRAAGWCSGSCGLSLPPAAETEESQYGDEQGKTNCPYYDS